MAETRESGGGGSGGFRTGGQSGGDVYLPKKDESSSGSSSNVWERNEFRERIRKIKERAKVAKPEVNFEFGRGRSTNRKDEKKPSVPLPTSISKPTPVYRSDPKEQRRPDIVQSEVDRVLKEGFKSQIRQEMKGIALPGGVTQERFEDVINKKAEQRLDAIKKPRYVLTADGTPFFLDKKEERKALEQSLQYETPTRRTWTMLKYDLANGIGNVIKWISEPSMALKEHITDDPVVGGMLETGYNAAILGWEYVRAANDYEFGAEEKVEQLKQEAAALKYTDPTAASAKMDEAERYQAQLDFNTESRDRIAMAKQAVLNAWNKVHDAYEFNKELAEERKQDMAKLAEETKGMTLQESVEYTKKRNAELEAKYGTSDWAEVRGEEQRRDAARQARSLRSEANTAYSQGNYTAALELIKKAQEADRNSEAGDPYGAYTWVREPERYNKFLEDAALIELQKGERLSRDEIRRLKEYHQNGWTEMGGELIFDPLNLIPGGLLDDAVKVPLKGAVRANQALETAFPIYARVTNVLGSPVRWLRRETVTSGANKVALKTHGIFDRVSQAYTTTDDTVRAIDEIGTAVQRAKAAGNEKTARQIFTQTKEVTPGLQNITFREFKQLMDADDFLSADKWGKTFQEALIKSEDDLVQAAKANNVDPATVISEISKTRRALMEVSTRFHSAFVDPHRIFKGSSFTDDTISGWAVKTMRELAGDDLNDLLKVNGFDDFISKVGQTFSPRSRKAVSMMARATEGVLYVAGTLRDAWATVVLTTPRWIVSNLIDTSMRNVVYGGNLWDDMFTLFTSTQRHLADELGVVPLAFSQALSRSGLDYGESVTSRLLYEGWKPKAGLFSYWSYEYRRLFKGDAVAAKRQIMDEMLGKVLPNGKLKDALSWLGDGFYVKTPLFTQAWSGAISDFNTAIEFTFRLRMFHREYFNLLGRLEPSFLARGVEGLSPATKEIATQIWKAADGNPRRVTAYAEALVGKKVKGTPAQWALIVPPEIERVTKGMDVVDRQLFVSSVRQALDEFIGKSARSGENLRGADFSKFFDDYVDKFRDEMQARMSQTHSFKDIDTTINTSGKVTETPTVNDLKGSAPIPSDESVRNAAIEKATQNIQKGKRASTENIVKDFETAISDYATIKHVPGDKIGRTVEDGKVIIEMGDDVLKKGPTALYDELHETMIQVFKHTDSDIVLHSGFKNLDEYEQAFRDFMNDPAAILNADERKFLTLANQMDAHPQMRELIERTRDRVNRETNKIKYDSLMDLYRDIGVYSDGYGFTKPPEKIFETQAQKLRAQPGYHVAAAQESAQATAALARAETNLPQALADKVADFRDYMNVFREELKQFYAFTYPGPLMKSTRDAERHAGWERFYKMSADEFTRETEIKQRLLHMLQSDPVAAEKYIDTAMNDFGTWFLKENGIELEWDADMQRLMNIKVTAEGRVRNFTNNDDLAHLQRRIFTTDINRKIADAPFIRLRKDARTKLHNQLRNALRDTFDLPTAHAEAWAKVIDSHAAKWAQETGRDVTEYYERLGFQRVDDARGLFTRENTRVVKRGAVQRADGNFVFYGLGQSNFESMVRESAELFFDDMVSMAEHSAQAADDLKALKSFIESKTPGKPIRMNRLDQDHSNILTDLFTSYIAHGEGPDIKVKGGIEKFKGWLAATFDAVKDTPVAGEMAEDTYRILDRLFIEQKINDVPKTNKRTIKLIAKEAGVEFKSDDELLRIINESVSPTSTAPDISTLSPEMLEQRRLLVQALNDAEQNYADIQRGIAEAVGQTDDRLQFGAGMAGQGELEPAKEQLEAAMAALDQFDAGVPSVAPKTFTDLGDVPKDIALKALGTPESKLAKELQEAWDVWKTKRSLAGFPDDALSNPDVFKQYLKDRSMKEWSETAAYYNRLLWEVEQMENAMLNYHAGDDMAEVLFPRVPEAQISSGMKTFLRNNEKMVSNYESALQALETWKRYVVDIADNGHPAWVMPDQMAKEIAEWSKRAAADKARLMDIIVNGNDEITGAVDLVNKRMIDYQHSNLFDNAMRNFFPFWKFPSRSIPFWAETLVTHPQLIANYEKLQRMSRSQRYQAGAVTSQGKPMPSLDGYIQLPGTDMWFNPLAPMSFRYILDIAQSKDDVLYQAQSAEEDGIDPKAWMVKELMQQGQVYGFTLSPWMAYLMKSAYDVPDEIVPRYPLAPQIPLIPRWAVFDLIQKANKITLPGLGIEVDNLGDTIYPEVPWHDYLVERRILENVYSQVQNMNIPEADKLKLVNAAEEAIKAKGDNALWAATYKEVTQEEWVNSMTSFFTGYHPKQFSDVQADMRSMLFENYKLRSALNNEFQSDIFDLPANAEDRYANYLDRMDTPDGWIYRLYSEIGWVRDENKNLVNDPKDRAKFLALAIEQDEQQQLYYDKMGKLQQEYNDRVRALPVGAPWEQRQTIYEWYSTEREKLEVLRTQEKLKGTNKPSEMIQDDLTREWFQTLKSTKPIWNINKGETYGEYQARVTEWEASLPDIAASYMGKFQRRLDVEETLHNLKADQRFDTGTLYGELLAMSNVEGLEQWDKENDDVFDALNKAWKATYWDGYWNAVIGKDGYDVDLAERDFYSQNPEPPNSQALYAWIAGYYGDDRFTFDDISRWTEDTQVLSVEDRRLLEQDDKEDYKKRQDIWNMLSWIGPGNRNRGVFNEAFANSGGDPDMLTVWYEEAGEGYQTQPDKLDKLHADLTEAMKLLQLKEPTRAELLQFVQAQNENDTFKQLVTDELGNRFFDYEDENGVRQPGLLTYYNSLDSTARREFRKTRDEYTIVQSYYDMRETFGEDHPTWNDYFGLETEPTVTLPENESGSTFTPPNPQGPAFSFGGGSRGGGGGKNAAPTSVFPPMPVGSSSGSNYVNFYIEDRTGNNQGTPYLSQGLYDLVGNKMAWEIKGTAGGRKISSSGISFLRSLASRYPQYRQEISQILARGT